MTTMIRMFMAVCLVLPISAVFAADMELGDFETKENSEWKIPDWALEKGDHVAKEIEVSAEKASTGKQSLKILTAFPGEIWTAAVVEREEYLDLTGYTGVAFDVYVPGDAPGGLKADVAVTYGSNWTWAEAARSVPLKPGHWTTVVVDISDGSKDWIKTRVDGEFRSDVRKMTLRVISDKKPSYLGPIYIDNVRAVIE